MFYSPTNSPSVGFRVPDEDLDSVSDSSREVSLQVIDCHHTRTYSVPSSEHDLDSDEEDAEFSGSSPSPAGADKPAAATTPSRQPEMLGTSQQHPIDLEDGPLQKDDNPETDSEDEGPEVLPINQPYSPIATRITAVPTAADVTFLTSNPGITVKPVVHVEHDVEQVVIAESDTSGSGNSYNKTVSNDEAPLQAECPRFQTPNYLPRTSNGNITDDFDSVDEDDYDKDDGFDMGKSYPERLLTDYSVQRARLCAFNSPKPCVAHGLLESYPEEPSHGPINWSAGMDVSQASQTNYLAQSQRPPSPSDAALAKKRDRPMEHLPSIITAPHDYFTEIPKSVTDSNWAANYNQTSSVTNEPLRPDFSDESDPELTRYEDGPFVPHSSLDRSPQLSSLDMYTFIKGIGASADMPMLESSNGKLDSPQVSGPVFVSSMIGSRRAPADQVPPDDQAPAAERNLSNFQEINASIESAMPESSDKTPFQTSRFSEGSQSVQKDSGCQPSKVKIADLVNPYAEVARGWKRKVDNMSSDIEVRGHLLLTSRAASVEVPGSQDVVLPDAQPRDHTIDDVSLRHDTSVSSFGAVSTQTLDVAADLNTDGPVRKKPKLSASTSGGIGRFVSGVCVGAAGALVALIATIPLSVREEALHEAHNAI